MINKIFRSIVQLLLFVGHIIDKPLDTGYFLSQRWNAELPTAEQVLEIEPWQGWSILSFWHDVQQQGLLCLRFQPAEPHFGGDVPADIQAKDAMERAMNTIATR